MSVNADDFGAGIVDPAAEPIQQPVQQTAVTNPVATPVDNWSQFRSQFSGLPDDVTNEQLADSVIEWQQKASESETLRQRVAEYEARAAQEALARSQSATQVTAPAPDPVADLRFKPVVVDPELSKFVVQDPSGGWAPKNAANGVHIAAAQQMNQRAQYENSLLQSFLDDPYGTIAELSNAEIAKIQKLYDERLAKIESRFDPIAKTVEEQQFEMKREAWAREHADELFVDAETMTPIGKQVHECLLTGKFTEDEALAFAKKVVGDPDPAPVTPKVPSLSKVAKPAIPATPQPRMIDKVHDRVRRSAPTEKTPFDRSSGKWNKSFEEIFEEVDEQFGTAN